MHSEAARRDDCSIEEVGQNIVPARISFIKRIGPRRRFVAPKRDQRGE